MSDAVGVIDARGLLCPWPALRLSRAARQMNGAGAVRIRADDPIAPAELAKLCGDRGWTLLPDPADPTLFLVRF